MNNPRAIKPSIVIPLSERPTTSVDEFCSIIGFGRSSAYKAIAAGDLHAVKYGKRTFITLEERKRFVSNLPPQSATKKKPVRTSAAGARR